jgi:hypothetical protein
MTFQELVNTLKAEGYDYCVTNQLEDWVQRSYAQLSARYQWPWLEETKETTAPFEIKDLRYVLSVTDTTQERPLWGATRQWILERYPKLEENGNAVWWFLDNLTLRLFPLSEDKVAVRYVKKAPKLEAATEPLIPTEWQYLIIDQARVFALKNNDEFQVANELKASVQADLNEMIADQLRRDWQSNRSIVRTAPYGYGYL